MTDRFPDFLNPAIDSSGNTISGAQLFFYRVGTSTKKNTFSDSAKTVANANPLVADSGGRFGDIFMLTDEQYKVILAPATDTDPPVSPIATWDFFSPVRANPVPKITTLAKSANYTVLTTNEGFIILVDASSGAVTVTLPVAATAADGFSIRVKKTDSSVNVVTVDGDSAETIDGFTTFALGSQYAAGTFVTNETTWHVASEGRNSQSLAVSKSANYTVVAGDRNKTFIATSTFTLALTAAATLGDGFVIWVRNDGTGIITVDPTGAETIDGVATLALSGTVTTRIVCDGANFKTTGASAGDISMAKAPPEISNGTDATNDIDIAVGKCRDDADTANLEVTTAIGKQIDVSWVAGGTVGAPTGGLSSTLTLTNDTWYHVILGLVSGSIEAGFDTSVTGANLITDHSFTNTRRIGSVRRGTATNLAFVQNGDDFRWVATIQDLNDVNGDTAGANFTLTVPPDVRVWAQLTVSTQTQYAYFSATDENNEAAASTRAQVGASASNLAAGYAEVLTDTSSQIRYRTSSTNGVFATVIGWRDRRGRDS